MLIFPWPEVACACSLANTSASSAAYPGVTSESCSVSCGGDKLTIATSALPSNRSKRARSLLDDWDNALGKFVKVMPRDYRNALRLLETERLEAASVAAE